MSIGIEYFSDCCKQLGINFEDVFCYGRGGTYYTKGKNIQQYVFKPSDKQLRESHKYVLKYFADDKIFLCWDLKYNHKTKRRIFNADRKDVLSALGSKNLMFFGKGIINKNADQERVYVLTADDVMAFLQNLKADI